MRSLQANENARTPLPLRCHIARGMLTYCQHLLVAFIRDYHLDDRAQTTQRISALQQAYKGCKYFRVQSTDDRVQMTEYRWHWIGQIYTDDALYLSIS